MTTLSAAIEYLFLPGTPTRMTKPDAKKEQEEATTGRRPEERERKATENAFTENSLNNDAALRFKCSVISAYTLSRQLL